VAAVGVPTALAAGTWTVQPGGGVQARSAGRVTLTIFDPASTSQIACASSAASGTLRSGSGLPGADAGSLSAVSFLNCSGLGGLKFVLQPAGLPWHVNFSRYNATTGVARGTITHVRIMGSANGCSFVIAGLSAASDGRVTSRYTNSTGRLKMQPSAPFGSLHIYDVSAGCPGAFNDGDPAVLSGPYAVSPKQAITSP
jgi:hypothetical protein